LLDLDNSPPNYQRILVHSRLTNEQLRSVASLPPDLVPSPASPPAVIPDWLVLWSDFHPTNQSEEELRERVAGSQPRQTFDRGGLRVAIYRLR
jgi:hypothetical protein